jgi:triacylglycerol lipase
MNLVFVSGFLFPQKIIGADYFCGMPGRYPDACFPDVPVAGSIAARAQALARQIARRFPRSEIHIIAHSMGGLDARYLLSQNLLGLSRPGRVVSLSTVSTPHHGSPLADLLLGPQRTSHNSRRFAYGVMRRILSRLGMGSGALQNLTTGFAKQFNLENPKLEHIRYFCYAGSGDGSVLLSPTHAYLESCGNTPEEKANDGLVSISSASWPGSLSEAPWPTDHLGEIGHYPGLRRRVPRFDHLAAFDRVIRNASAKATSGRIAVDALFAPARASG